MFLDDRGDDRGEGDYRHHYVKRNFQSEKKFHFFVTLSKKVSRVVHVVSFKFLFPEKVFYQRYKFKIAQLFGNRRILDIKNTRSL